MPGLQLSIVFVQYHHERHQRALDSLLRAVDRLTIADPFIAVVDNADPGDWVERGPEGLVRVGGDGWAREFSAFDRGLAALAAVGRKTDVFAVVTDSLLAYGGDYLELVDDRALACCHQLQACLGLVDTWGAGCRIGDLPFDAWLRTCFVLLPPRILSRLEPLAADLETLQVFGNGPAEPFSSDARLSRKVRQCLMEWLTTRPVRSPHLQWHWHSRFDLTADTWPLFRAKASAILREQLLSARLQHARVPCYDYRSIRRVAERGGFEAFLDAGGQRDLEWLGWLADGEEAATARLSAAPPWSGPRGAASSRPAPLLLLLGEPDEPRFRRAAAYFGRNVLPLIRQRFAGARLERVGREPAPRAGAAADPPRLVMRLSPGPGRRPAKRSSPLADLAFAGPSEGPAGEGLAHDGSAPRIARLCCRLLETGGA